MRGARWGLALLLVVGMSAASRDAGAQQASLDRIEELVRLGRTTEARGALEGWWSDARSGASREDVQHALWLRGRLAADPREAAVAYRRLVVEYPGGRWSAGALLRLAQASHALGDGEAVRRYVEQLQRDHPDAPEAREALSWLDRAGPVPPPPEGDSGAAGAPSAGAAAASAGAAAATTGSFAVQLGAFRQEARARALAEALRQGGFSARLVRVPGSTLVRVRAGRFDAEGPAGDLLRRLTQAGFTGVVVKDAHREEPVR